MSRISLTEFIDFVAAGGASKARKAIAMKNREPYSPARDFYKPLRERIVETHREDKPKSHIQALMPKIHDQKKLSNYPAAIAGYSKWWGRKTFSWFSPPRQVVSVSGIDLAINPELGLNIKGVPHLIKLYFKGDKLSKNKVDIILQALEDYLGPKSPAGTTMGVLDIRQSKLYVPTVHIPHLSAFFAAELKYITDLWDAV